MPDPVADRCQTLEDEISELKNQVQTIRSFQSKGRGFIMTIQIYNTLTRKKEPFIPMEEGKVKMYVCGPTVYNYIHIGNARPVIAFDTVRRYLEYRGYDVTYVSNFTDVDDKIIKAANELGEEVGELTDRFIAAYFEDVSALGCGKADVHPRVTDHIEDIVEFRESANR